MRLSGNAVTLPPSFAARLWRGWARAVVLLGMICAMGSWGIPDVVATAVVTLLVSTGVALLVDGGDFRRSLRIASLVTAALLACSGVWAVLGWSGMVLLAPLGVVGWLLGTTAVTGPPAEDLEAESQVDVTAFWVFEIGHVDAESLRGLTDLELCTAWRRSFSALSVAVHLSLRLEVTRVRQLYLDEIERRHPVELRRWLASGARAAGNPMPFLTGRRGAGAEQLGQPADARPADGRT